MKAVRAILILLIAAGLVACATTGTGKDAGTVIYENDFSTDDGTFEVQGEGSTRIEDGTLHVVKGDPWIVLREPVFGDNTDTSFRIKFGDPVFAHLNFLMEDEKRLLMHVMDQNIVFHSNIHNEAAKEEAIEVSLVPGQWYEFTISIRDPRVTVHIDGEEVGTIMYHQSFPPKGNLAFEAHGEYWMDDLKVVEFAGMGTEVREIVVYENNFSEDDGAFEFHGGEINRVEDGVLHLKQGDAEDAWTVLRAPLFGNNSDTSFRILFGDPVSTHLNFLLMNNSRLLFHVKEGAIYIGSIVTGETVADDGIDVNLVPDRWYDFKISIRDTRVSVSIDGEETGTAEFDERLPDRGHLAFEAHGEYEIDNLKIVEIGGGTGAGGGEQLGSIEEEGMRDLLLRWEEIIRSRDHEGFAELTWPEITLEFRDRKGRRTDFRSLAPVRRFRLEFFEGLGPLEDYRLPEPRHHEVHGDGSGVSYGFSFRDQNVDEWVHAVHRDGEWKIGHLEIVMHVPGHWVTNRWQALADENDDGFLQGEEVEQLFQWTMDFFSGPHTVENPVDELFDRNGNGEIETREIEALSRIIFGMGFRWFSEFRPNWAANTIDINGDGELTDDELEIMIRYMARDPEVGFEQVNGKERGYFLGTAIRISFPDALFQEVPRKVENYIDELADRNGDGRIDETEQEIILSSTRHYHEAENYFERALDLNHEGRVNSEDVLLALQASAMGKKVLAVDNEPPYEVDTITDSLLDRDGNDMVDAEELEAAVAFLSGNMDWVDDVSQRLRDLADWNENGRIDRDDLEGVAGLILFPHPVNPEEPMDRESDRNDDGFIEPAELGITGGVTSKGAVPTLDDRIRAVRRAEEEPLFSSAGTAGRYPSEGREEEGPTGTSRDTSRETGFRSEYYERLGKIQDRKLAVISLDTQTAEVDEETAAGIIVFVENAFVNVGKVRVVERKNIEEILTEYEFQSTGLIDENTAIEIGKLSGADIIVIGSINRVGGIFYLNIKLIDVKTGEIIGSNIARAEDASEFLDMSNEAVYMLF